MSKVKARRARRTLSNSKDNNSMPCLRRSRTGVVGQFGRPILDRLRMADDPGVRDLQSTLGCCGDQLGWYRTTGDRRAARFAIDSSVEREHHE